MAQHALTMQVLHGAIVRSVCTWLLFSHVRVAALGAQAQDTIGEPSKVGTSTAGSVHLGALLRSEAKHGKRSPITHSRSMIVQPDASLIENHVRQGEGLPRIIHQTFKTHLANDIAPNPVWRASEESWKKFFIEGSDPGMFVYRKWSDDDIRSLFHTDCEPEVGPLPNYGNPVELSDIGRYCILWKFGGIYADLDYEPRANFFNLLDQNRVSLVQSPYQGETYQNSLMSAPAGTQIMLDAMRTAIWRFSNRPSGADANDLTGPRMLEWVPHVRDPTVVSMLPCKDFQRATHHNSIDDAKGCGMLTEEALSLVQGIHWGTWSWVSSQTSGHGDVGSSETMDLFQSLFYKLHSASL